MSEIDQKLPRNIPLDTYKLIRSYVDEENKLLNYRMTWLLTINGFLFASYAIAVPRAVDRQGSTWSYIGKFVSYGGYVNEYQQVHIFLIIICLLGMAVCINGKAGVKGARRSVFFIEKFVELNFDLHQLQIGSKPIKYESFLKRFFFRYLRVHIYKLLSKANNKVLIKLLSPLLKKLSDNRGQMINCVTISDIGPIPFITGGGYFKPARKTKMSSLKFIQFLLLVWSIMLSFSIYMVVPSNKVCLQNLCIHVNRQ